MAKKIQESGRRAPKTVLRLPDLDQAKSAVLNSLDSTDAQRGYRHAIAESIEWHCSEPRLSFGRSVVLRYRIHLESRHLERLTEKAIWHVVREYARKAGIERLAPHDLRRTCGRLCHAEGGELEQIQLLLGHVSIQATERYLGCKPGIRSAVNDRIGIEPGG